MKAIIKADQGPGIRLLDVDVPKTGGDGILVKVMSCGICGSDVSLYEWKSGEHGFRWWDGFLVLPVILGHEFSGYVVEVGP